MKDSINLFRKNHLVFTAYIIFGFAIYLKSLRYGFILDDEFQILKNPLVQDLSKWYMHLTNSTMSMPEAIGGIYYKPLMMITYAFLWKVGGGTAFIFHLFQLSLHVLNAFLVYKLFEHFFSKEKTLWALFAGFIFLCHPINAEAVLFIADLQEPLYTFFGLSAILLIVSPISSQWRICLAAFLFFCGLLSKESGVLYILVGLTYSFIFNKALVKSLLVSTGAVAIVYLALRLGLAELNSIHADTMQISRADLLTRLTTMPKVLIHYLHLFFYPANLSLTQDWVVTDFSWPDFWLPLLEVIAVLSLSLLFLYKTQEKKLFLLFFLWFCFGWGLHSQIIPLDGTVSDRWFYFTILGFLGMLLVFANTKFELSNLKLSIMLFLSTMVLSGTTYNRTLNWKNGISLYQHDLKINPESFYLNNNLGLEYMSLENYAEAIPLFEKTISLSDEKTRSWYIGNLNLSAAYLLKRDYKKAETFSRISLPYGDARSYRSLAWSLLAQNKYEELESFLKLSLEKFPNDAGLAKIKANYKN